MNWKLLRVDYSIHMCTVGIIEIGRGVYHLQLLAPLLYSAALVAGWRTYGL